ncbi:MAG: 50S ribosomal protein L4 [Desulfurococcales archaeon]|nr:50S ribosomal protein L4 [Desulfurococcales archaeon]
MYSTAFLYLRDPIVVPYYTSAGEQAGTLVLPDVFRVPVRHDLIRRVFLSEFTARLQPKGRDPMAGKRTSARSIGAHHGVSRVPRIRGSMRAAFAPMTVGGRLAHPPRVEKKIHEEVNKRERILGTMSALAATARPELVRARGHVFTAEALPVIVESSVLTAVAKAREARQLLQALGLYGDIERAKEGTRQRAGKGKRRGRRLKKPVSLLVVVEDPRSPFARAVKGFPGVTVAEPSNVNVLHLAPGGVPGRLTLITTGALQALARRFEVAQP